MRVFTFALGATLALMASGIRSDALAMTPAGIGLREGVEESALVEDARLVCTHFWNGHWHRSLNCLWVPGLYNQPLYPYDYYRFHRHHNRHHHFH
jgi:hypothetical protein